MVYNVRLYYFNFNKDICMLKQTAFYVFALSLSLSATAGTMGSKLSPAPLSPLSVGAYGGYGHVDGDYKHDGNVAMGRLALGLRVKEYNRFAWGVEAGVQSGNTMRLHAASTIIDAAGGLPAQSILKPIIDGLVTVKGQFTPISPFSYLLKGGVAYRTLQFQDRSSSHDTLNKVNGEFQAGIAYNVTDSVVLTGLYQGIYSTHNAGIRLNSVGDLTVSHIPTQQAGFLGIEYTFN